MKEIIFSVLITLVTSTGYSQFKNIKLDEKVNSERAFEPMAAISRKDANVVVSASMLNNLYSTVDGGQTWNRSQLQSTLGVWGTPIVISDFKGDFYYFHLSDPKNLAGGKIHDRVVVQESTDKGVTWNDGAFLGLNPPKDQDKHWVTVDRKGNFFATWTQFDKYGSEDSTCHSNILLSRSSNGSKWSKPIQISQTPGRCIDNIVDGAMAAVTENGIGVFISWTNQGKILFDRSMDGGDTFLSNDLTIVEQENGWNMKVPGINKLKSLPFLVCDNTKKGKHIGTLYLVWSNQTNGENDTDIWFSRSINFGDNWTRPVQINNDAPGKHQFLPSLTLDSSTGYLYVLYYDRRAYDDLQTDVYLAYSLDAGITFKNVKISESPFIPDETLPFGSRTSISASQGVIVPVWTRMDNGVTSVWTAIIKQEDLEKAK
jgi:hypothetical protein